MAGTRNLSSHLGMCRSHATLAPSARNAHAVQGLRYEVRRRGEGMSVAHPARARIATVVAAAALVTGVAVPVLAPPTGAAPLRILAVPDAYAVMTNSQIAKGARLGVLGNDVDPNPGATPSAA